jgi:hypothetical protein
MVDCDYILLTGVGAVFGETTVHRHAVGLEVLAEQFITTTAVEAGSAQLRVIRNNTLSDLEIFDFWSDGGDDADGFVAGNQRELYTRQHPMSWAALVQDLGYLGNEFTLVDVQVGTANTAGLDLDLLIEWSAPFFTSQSALFHTKTSFSRSSGTGTSTMLCFLGSVYIRARIVLGMLVSLVMVVGRKGKITRGSKESGESRTNKKRGKLYRPFK